MAQANRPLLRATLCSGLDRSPAARAAQQSGLPSCGNDLANRKGMGMLVIRSAAVMIAFIMMPAPSFGQSQGAPAIAPEYQEMIAKRAKERAKIENCHKQATEQKFSRAIARSSSSIAWTAMPVVSHRLLRQSIGNLLQSGQTKKNESTIARSRPPNEESCREIARNSSSAAWKNNASVPMRHE